MDGTQPPETASNLPDEARGFSKADKAKVGATKERDAKARRADTR